MTELHVFVAQTLEVAAIDARELQERRALVKGHRVVVLTRLKALLVHVDVDSAHPAARPDSVTLLGRNDNRRKNEEAHGEERLDLIRRLADATRQRSPIACSLD